MRLIRHLLLAVMFVPAAPGATDEPEPSRAAREIELQRLNADLDQGRARTEALAREIADLKTDRVRLDQALIAAAARIREREDDLTRTEQRLSHLDAEQAEFAAALAGRRKSLADALAAMQRLGRSPPAALLARPKDALSAVRSALLLGGVVGDLKARAEALSADLARAAALRARIARSRDTLAEEAAALAAEQQRLALIIAEKQRLQAESQKALGVERTRVASLQEEARSLEELIARMETDMNRPVVARPTAFAPSLPFAAAQGRLVLPASGVRLRGFGETDRFGAAAQGLSIATRAEARVTAPSDGEVVYGGPFRSYGQLLIINAGGGYHIVLAGMERIEVAVGQFVLAGEPIAVMGALPPGGAPVLAARAGQPILYVEFRKDGAAIDPTPWWASKSLEKVRG